MRKFWLLLTALCILLLGLTAPVAAQDEGFFVSTTMVEPMADVDAFWTPERIAQALANPKDLAKGGSGALLSLSSEETEGPQLSSPGYCPDCADTSDPPEVDSVITLGATCPASAYESIFDTDYNSYPQRVVGKVIFQSPNGELGSCSAALVESRIILTAGHCVSENGDWMTSLVFKPGYLDGNSPYGEGHAEWVTTPGEWLYLELPTRDVAFVRISENLGDQLGWLGITANAGRNGTSWEQYGYPADDPFDGYKLAKNTSAWGYDDCTSGPPCTMGVGSSFTGGSSGGPWVLNQDGDLYANGVNSYYYNDCATTMYSPYFDQTIWDLFQDAKATQ
jgi:V8-like Glu-specific endopeptidase